MRASQTESPEASCDMQQSLRPCAPDREPLASLNLSRGIQGLPTRNRVQVLLKQKVITSWTLRRAV